MSVKNWDVKIRNIESAKCWICNASSWRYLKIVSEQESEPFSEFGEILDVRTRVHIICRIICLECYSEFELKTSRPVEFMT